MLNDGRVGFIDFGIVGSLAPASVQAMGVTQPRPFRCVVSIKKIRLNAVLCVLTKLLGGKGKPVLNDSFWIMC